MMYNTLMQIPLTQGYVTEIDDIDSDLAQFKWRYLKGVPEPEKGYAVREIRHAGKRSAELLHRVILERKLGRKLQEKETCDHWNRNGLDNRRVNLRLASKSQSACNRGVRKQEKTSRFKGVYWRKSHRKWVAQINIEGKPHYLGHFTTQEDAALAYDAAAKYYHGNFAALNQE